MSRPKLSKRDQNKYLGQLASLSVLGRPSEILIPESFDVLRKLFADRNFTFVWTDGRGLIKDMYTDNHDAIEIFMKLKAISETKIEYDAGTATVQLVKNQIYCHNSKYNYSSFTKSIMYNEYIAPANLHKPTRFVLFPDRLDRNGLLIASTEKNEDFMTDEETSFFVSKVRPILVNILNFEPEFETNNHTKTRNSQRTIGSIVVNTAGEIEFADTTAKNILDQIQRTGYVNSPALLSRKELEITFTELIEKLEKCANHDETSPPEYTLQSRQGVIKFVAQTLWRDGKVNRHHFQIKILHEAPIEFLWIHQLGAMKLSPKERFMVLEILKGKNIQDSSRQLGMSYHTGISHFKSILRKLKVESREQLCALFR